jgi:hypothetical protein
MTRPTGAMVAAALTFSGAMILALGSFGFFLVGVMVATGDESAAPMSVAITGMAVAGGFMLLILAVVAAWMAMNAGELREWSRTVSVTAIAASLERRSRNVFGAMAALRRSVFAELVSSHKSRRLEHRS